MLFNRIEITNIEYSVSHVVVCGVLCSKQPKGSQMSEEAVLLLDGNNVVLVVGRIDSRLYKMLLQNMQFASELNGRLIPVITVDLPGSLLAAPEVSTATPLQDYLRHFTKRVFVPSVVVRRIYSAHPGNYVRDSFEEVFPEAIYEFVGDVQFVPTGESINHLKRELSIRCYNSLLKAGVGSIEDLVTKTQLELEAIPGIGKWSMAEIRSVLDKRGLSLRASEA